jgi:cobalt transporter subunit CbtA
MATFRSIVFVAALAGLIAGVFATVLQAIGTVPIILEAETYEAGGAAAAAADGHQHDAAEAGAAAHQHEADAWAPADGLERTAFTLLANILTGVAFALLLTAAYALRGGAIDWRRGLFWGLAGFAIFTLAPGLGLPPEIPGMEAAPLADRQIWWLATVIATAAGLGLIFLSDKPVLALLGIAVIALPHLYGAPQPAEHGSLAPASLAHRFVVAAVLTSFLFWVALGSLTGWLYQRSAGSGARDRGRLQQPA